MKSENTLIDRIPTAQSGNPFAAHPEYVKAIDAGLVARLHDLTDGVEVDLDAALSPDDE